MSNSYCLPGRAGGSPNELGESAKSLERYQVPISKATTPSLEALKAFSLGEARHSLGEFLAAVPFYQRAIELDPNFALAYARLGVDQGAQDEELSEENLKKAFELRDRASGRERLYITAHYYDSTGQLEEQTQTWELYKQTYPRDPIPYTNLAALYSGLGQYDKELENSLEAVPLAPDNAIGYLNAAHAYMCLNRLEEAKAILDNALQRKVGGHFIHLDLSSIAIAQGDIAAQEREDASIKGNAEGDLDLVSRDAGLAASGANQEGTRVVHAGAPDGPASQFERERGRGNRGRGRRRGGFRLSD